MTMAQNRSLEHPGFCDNIEDPCARKVCKESLLSTVQEVIQRSFKCNPEVGVLSLPIFSSFGSSNKNPSNELWRLLFDGLR